MERDPLPTLPARGREILEIKLGWKETPPHPPRKGEGEFMENTAATLRTKL